MGKKKNNHQDGNGKSPSSSKDTDKNSVRDKDCKLQKDGGASTTKTSSFTSKALKLCALLTVAVFGVWALVNLSDVKHAVDNAGQVLLGSNMHTALHALFQWDTSEDVQQQYEKIDKPGASDGKPASKQSANAKQSPTYRKADITNVIDSQIQQELDLADSAVKNSQPSEAVKLYDSILARYPNSPRAIYGKARALNALAEKLRSNAILEQAIETCLKILHLPDVPKKLLITASKFCAEKQSFRGWIMQGAATLHEVLKIYPDELEIMSKVGVMQLMAGRNEEARNSFQEVLNRDEDNGYALVHLGFIIKTIDHDYEKSIPLLQRGIDSGAAGVIDGRFFFQLGDAYYRTGRHEEAMKTYELGAKKGVFLSTYQRSLYNVKNLTSRPWWTIQQTGNEKQLKRLAEHWQEIRDEGLMNLNAEGLFTKEREDLTDTGDWRQLTLYVQGRKSVKNCQLAPKTCALLEGFKEATGCTRGQVKFSVMQPGVHVWPHCGPTNCRIRSHLGLVVPDGPRIRVGNETRTWEAGQFIVFDDSFEHEVWHDGKSVRLVLIVDMWHPELTQHQKINLSPI